MNDDERLSFTLEVINGDWALLAFILMLMCAFYLGHEMLARHISLWHPRSWEQGMRVATAIGAMSTGVFMTRIVIYSWRHYFEAAAFSHVQAGTLIVGATIGTVGFVCAIREISKPLYGDWPWVLSIVLLAMMTGYTLISHYS